MIELSRDFLAPKKSNIAQWKKVAYLIEHGFLFQHVYKHAYGGAWVEYPKTLNEAKGFVEKYKRWAIPCDRDELQG